MEESPTQLESAPVKKPVAKLAEILISEFQKKEEAVSEQTISVNPFVSKVAAWYEKLRNAMEYREDEVILRAAIERILKRKLLLGGNAKSTAEPLLRELIWARYLPDDKVPVSFIAKVESAIDLYLQLRSKILQRNKISDSKLNEWIYHLLSSEIAHIVATNREEDVMSNFMYQRLKDFVTIADDSSSTRNAQVYIAVRRAFAKDDVAFLRYHMFGEFFGSLTKDTIDTIATNFGKGYKEIERQLNYPKKEAIFTFVKRQAAPFLILEELFGKEKGTIDSFIQDKERFEKELVEMCKEKYKGIAQKVRRAIVRSVLFILLSKFIFAFLVEGTYERIFYGQVFWNSMIINIAIPPMLMIVVSLFLKTPGGSNTKKIYLYIQSLLFEENPKLANPIKVRKKSDSSRSFLQTIFTLTWFLAFMLSFGAIFYILGVLHFHFVNKLIFIFFLAIVAFLSYRISVTADEYRLGEKQGLFTPFVDFLFVPIVRVGRSLSLGISQINFVIFFFDLLIETPFKVVFAFVEQWFYFLHSKRESLD